MYVKYGRIQRSSKLVDKILERDVVSWNSMIVGYVQYGFVKKGMQNGSLEKALYTFKQKLLENAKSNSVTFSSILPALWKLLDFITIKSLIDLYGNCGNMLKS